MNEQQLADLLAAHLDAGLAGQTPPTDLPAEIAELLSLGHTLAEAAPTPRPEFSPTLREGAWSEGANGSVGTVGRSGGGLPKTLFWLLGGGIVVTIGGVLVVGLILFNLFRPAGGDIATATTEPTQTQPVSLPPTQTLSRPTVTPTLTATATLMTTATPTATPTAMPTVTSTPENTSTPVVDEMIIIVTVEIEVDLQPGTGSDNADHSDGGGDSSGRGGSTGDRDRGHGNDEDGHDEDNPGRGN